MHTNFNKYTFILLGLPWYTMNKLYLTRKQKAKIIAENGSVRQNGIFSFIVKSQTYKGKSYAVFNDGITRFCECRDHDNTKRDCKHIMATDIVKYGMVKEVIAK